ncbi:MAG TPA: ABC transporter permease [Bryobacteraceae bacterium]|nr:ABC transporter permease [Bryobacteraceae bacterium]
MAWIDRLRNLIGNDDLERGLDEEMRFHIEARMEDNIKAGMSPAAARDNAVRRFGNRTLLKERTRDADLFPSVDAFGRDLRYALRTLLTTPGFAVVAILVLALGIGANTAVFSIVSSVLLRPLPFPEPGRLFFISYQPRANPFFEQGSMSDEDYLEFERRQREFESVATYGNNPVTLTGAGEPLRAAGVAVTTDFFHVLRSNAAIGRTFVPAEGEPGRNAVVIVSDKLWRDRFGADPRAVGRVVRLDGIPCTIIGVMPPKFIFPAGAELWTPLEIHLGHNSWARPVIGRLRQGVSAQGAEFAFKALASSLPIYPNAHRSEYEASVRGLHDRVVAPVRKPLLVFTGAVAFVLLIACANVANLLLIRAASRRHEISVRAALGASRWRLIRQLLTESLVTFVLGGAGGVLLAKAVTPALLALAPAAAIPHGVEIGLDFRVIVFAFGLSLLTGFLFGLAPAFQATRRDLRLHLAEGGRTSTGGRQKLRSVLVVAEVALALVLLTGAGLLLRSLRQILSVNPGFQPRNVLTATVDLPDSAYSTAAKMRAFHQSVLAKLSSVAGVQAVGAVNWIPLGQADIRGTFEMDGGYRRPPGFMAVKPVVSPGYFRAMGIRLLSGRAFSDHDNGSAPGVVIVSKSVARTLWRGDDPLGRRISMEDKPGPGDWLTVVGVVDDIRQEQLTDQPSPAIYQPLLQVGQPFFLSHMTFVLRTASRPRAVATSIRSIIRQVDADEPVQIASMDDAILGVTAASRFLAQVLGAFSIMAVLLSAIGLYGVVASSVAERTREIGIRMAMGASNRSVVRMVIRRTLPLAGAGVLIGAAGALAAGRVLRTFLFEVAPTDPLTFGSAALVLLGVAVAAALIPAWRAYTLDPVVVLRYQ